MRLTCVLGLSVLFTVFAPPAWGVTYPGEQPVHGALMGEAVAVGREFWTDRHVTPCTAPTVYVAANLDGPDTQPFTFVVERTDGCTIWVLRDTWLGARQRTRLGLINLCRVIVHALGHTAGLPHAPAGPMAASFDPSIAHGAPYPCLVWAKTRFRQG